MRTLQATNCCQLFTKAVLTNKQPRRKETIGSHICAPTFLATKFEGSCNLSHALRRDAKTLNKMKRDARDECKVEEYVYEEETVVDTEVL